MTTSTINAGESVEPPRVYLQSAREAEGITHVTTKSDSGGDPKTLISQIGLIIVETEARRAKLQNGVENLRGVEPCLQGCSLMSINSGTWVQTGISPLMIAIFSKEINWLFQVQKNFNYPLLLQLLNPNPSIYQAEENPRVKHCCGIFCFIKQQMKHSKVYFKFITAI